MQRLKNTKPNDKPDRKIYIALTKIVNPIGETGARTIKRPDRARKVLSPLMKSLFGFTFHRQTIGGQVIAQLSHAKLWGRHDAPLSNRSMIGSAKGCPKKQISCSKDVVSSKIKMLQKCCKKFSRKRTL